MSGFWCMNFAVNSTCSAEKFTKERLTNYIGKMCRNVGDKLYIQIALPDGEWFFKIVHYADGEWDYYIPDTRVEEQRIITELMNKAG